MSERLTKRLPNGGVMYDNGEYYAVCYPWNENCLTNIDRMAIRLCDLEDKIEQGEIVVLPCKVRDTLYVNYKDKVYPVNVNAIRIDTKKNNHRICVWGTFHIAEDYSHEYKATFSFDSIGKTVFLTREQAERALERSENGK